MVNVSIIIPTYNQGGYLPEAIDSVLRQTYRDYEIIVVDDGSSDRTREIAGAYVTRAPETVRYLYQSNRGAAAARNAGIRKAAGGYIAFLDVDDVWLPSKLEKQMQALARDREAGAVYCDNYFVDGQRRAIPGYRRVIPLCRGAIAPDMFCHYTIITSGIVIRKACIERVGWFREDVPVGEDYDYFLRLSDAFPVAVVNEKLFERRMTHESLSGRSYLRNAHSDIRILKEFVQQRPEFFRRNKALVLRRLRTYHFDAGYYCLRNGMNAKAFRFLAASLRYGVPLKTLKCLLMCMVPYEFVRFVKLQLRYRELDRSSSGA